MPNIQIPDHPLVGTTHTYRPASLGWEQYDPDLDTEGGTLIVGHGMPVVIKAAFQNWNGITGLDMLYVYCMATGYHTHVTPADLGLPPLDGDTDSRDPECDDCCHAPGEHPRVDAGPDEFMCGGGCGTDLVDHKPINGTLTCPTCGHRESV